MEKQKQVEHLRSKYIQLSRQYLKELQNGKTIRELKDMSELISSLIAEIDAMEQDIERNKTE